jgi:hypothetical protein
MMVQRYPPTLQHDRYPKTLYKFLTVNASAGHRVGPSDMHCRGKGHLYQLIVSYRVGPTDMRYRGK